MASDAPTRADWHTRLAPSSPDSGDGTDVLDLEDVAERLTAHPAVQAWLREAGFEAARGLRQADAMAEARAHGRMRQDLEAEFPALVEAVQEVTGGCGQLALQWRPLQPSYSKVHLAFFGGDLEPRVFCTLASPALSAVRHALRAVADALPKGDPFPGRPNEATSVLEHDGRCLGVRYREHAGERDTPRRTVTLLPTPEDVTGEYPEAEAARGIVAYFAPEERERWYEQ